MNKGVVLIAAVALALVVTGSVTWLSERRQPSKSVPDGGPIVAVLMPDLAADAMDGRESFEQNCAACHGTMAEGRNGQGPPLVHKIYEPGHHADGAFYLAVSRGVRAHHWPFGDMPPVDGVSQQDIGKIVSYVRALQRANGIY